MKKIIALIILLSLTGCYDTNATSILSSSAINDTNNSTIQLPFSDTETPPPVEQEFQENECPQHYLWLYEEMKLRNDQISEKERNGVYPLGRPGVVICLSDLNEDEAKEFFIGEWHISAILCEIEYTLFNHLGERELDDTFSIGIDSDNELFPSKKYTSISGEKYILGLNKSASDMYVEKLYYKNGWRIDRSVYDHEKNQFGLPMDK